MLNTTTHPQPDATTDDLRSRRPKRDDRHRLLFIAGVAVAAVAATVIAIMMLNESTAGPDPVPADGSQGSDASVVADSEASAEPEAAADPAASAEPEAAVDPTVTISTFAQAWLDGDWETMATVGSPEAVSVAKEWYESNASITGCTTVSSGHCEFVYGDNDGFGLIFQVDLSEDGASVNGLTWAGDAG